MSTLHSSPILIQPTLYPNQSDRRACTGVVGLSWPIHMNHNQQSYPLAKAAAAAHPFTFNRPSAIILDANTST